MEWCVDVNGNVWSNPLHNTEFDCVHVDASVRRQRASLTDWHDTIGSKDYARGKLLILSFKQLIWTQYSCVHNKRHRSLHNNAKARILRIYVYILPKNDWKCVSPLTRRQWLFTFGNGPKISRGERKSIPVWSIIMCRLYYSALCTRSQNTKWIM